MFIVSELIYGELLETFIFLPLHNLARVAKVSDHKGFGRTASALLLPMKSPVASAVF